MEDDFAPRRILVVDDNLEAADILVELFQIFGYEAIATYDGNSAVRLAAQYKPDVVFCDIGMPGMDGYEVAEILRCMTALDKTRLVALTAWGDNEACTKVSAAGFHFHLVKPATFDTILCHLKPTPPFLNS